MRAAATACARFRVELVTAKGATPTVLYFNQPGAQSGHAASTGAQIWPAASVLLRCAGIATTTLAGNEDNEADASGALAACARASSLLSARRRRVIELGAGTGIVGFTLAAYGHDVLLTDTSKVAVPSYDLEGAYEGDTLVDSGLMRTLEGHADDHARDIERGGGRARVADLPWGDAAVAAAASHIGAWAEPPRGDGGDDDDDAGLLVVGTDITYDKRDWPKLLVTLRALVAGESVGASGSMSGSALLAVQERATPASAFYRAATEEGWSCSELHRDESRAVSIAELTLPN